MSTTKFYLSNIKGRFLIVFLPVIFFTLFLLASCEDFFISEARNVKIPGSEPQLVVYSFISPQDTLIRVFVDRTIPHVMDPKDVKPVNGEAHVYMAKKGEEFTKLSYDEQLKVFTIRATDFAVEAEKEYVLRVESFKGEVIEATCFVPANELDTVIFRDPVQMVDSWGGPRAIISWEVHPRPSSQTRYFRSGAYVKSLVVFPGINDTLFYAPNPIWLDRGNEFFTYTNEAPPAFRGEYYGYLHLDQYVSDGSLEYIDSLFSVAMQTDYHYYRFHQSVENYFYHDEDFPFSEAVHIYTNIQGGLGVFGGYNKRVFLGAATPPKD